VSIALANKNKDVADYITAVALIGQNESLQFVL
jgi:hypothetical protein